MITEILILCNIYHYIFILLNNNTIASIPKIIKEPSFVYYDPNKKSLLYFKEIDENVCVVVKLNLRKNKNPYVATIYPVNDRKIEKLKELSYILNR